MKTQVLGLSVDSVPCLQAWAESLDGISYPLLSDFFPHGQVARTYGILRSDGKSERAIFVIDKNRIIRYVDVHDIDEQPDNDELFRVLEELEPEAASSYTQETAKNLEDQIEPAADADVIMYCTAWCPACRRARVYLKANSVPFVEIDITRDREAAKRVREWAGGNETTPTFDIKGTIIVDFDRDKLNEVLGLN
jgi:glutaredoxin